MPRKRWSEEQIVYAVKPSEAGRTAAEICRELGMSQQTFYTWKRRYQGIGVQELRELRQLRDENRRHCQVDEEDALLPLKAKHRLSLSRHTSPHPRRGTRACAAAGGEPVPGTQTRTLIRITNKKRTTRANTIVFHGMKQVPLHVAAQYIQYREFRRSGRTHLKTPSVRHN